MTDRKTALAKRPESPTGELVVLPASAEKPDKTLVDRAVAHIRDVVSKTVARGLDDVGTYLLREFYDDDPALYLSASPSKHASLSMLIERCESLELPVSRTFLANALRMASVTKQLPRAATFHKLPPSHRVELLRVRAPEKLERLASKVVEGKLSVQKLRTLVQKEQEKSKEASGRGRRRSPEVLKAIEACLRVLRDEETGKLLFHRSDVTEMTDEQRAKADVALKSLEKRVTELRRILG
ncbi:MAG: hypothetical protein J0L92_36980 [Deltaproteobacteria bacterium]|nr:hypothetical protein [Deltaproteobacteria bacterium]